MRGGKVVGRDLYRTESLKDESEVLPEFLIAYYTDPQQIPPHIFVFSGQGHELAEQWFADRFGVQVVITAIPLEEKPAASSTDEAYSDPEAAEAEEDGSVETAADSVLPSGYAKRTDGEAGAVKSNPSHGAVSDAVEATEPHSNYGAVSDAVKAAEPHLNYGAVADTAEKSSGNEPPSLHEHLAAMPSSVLRRHRAALAMARFNAKEDAARRLKELGDFPAVEELQKVLGLEHPPRRIEGFDIAHLHGKYTVASLISFKDGNPDKKNYRIFRLRKTDGIIDDYTSMREAVARRYTRLVNEGAELPDLIMIDGGIGQVNAAKSILDALELDIPLVGLAEKNEELYRPHVNRPIVLPRRSAALRLLQRVRDETHRFANTRNNRLRSKESLHLVVEQLPHIGAKRAAVLLRSFSSIEKLAAASAEAAASALKITPAQAEEVIAAAGNYMNGTL